MRPNLQRSLIAGIGLMIAMLAAGGAINYRNVQTLNSNNTLVAKTLEVDQAVGEILRLATDTVASQRGYLLSGEASFLERYGNAVARLPPLQADLRTKVQDNASQIPRTQRLSKLIDALTSTLQAGIDSRALGLESGEAIRAAQTARERLDEIRETIAEILAEERQLLADREADARHAYRIALWGGLIALGMGVLLFAGIVAMARRNMEVSAEQQARLFAERERLEVTLGSIGDAVIATDTDSRITQLNGVAERLTGWSAADAVGKPLPQVLDLVDDATGQARCSLLEHVLTEGREVRNSDGVTLISRAGESRPISGSASPIRGAQGNVLGAVLTLRDVSDEIRARRLESNRARLVALRADIGLFIARSGDHRQILQQCVDAIAERVPAESVGVWEKQPTHEQLTLVAAAGPGASSAPATLPQAAADELLKRVVHELRLTASHTLKPDSAGEGRSRRFGFPLVVEDRLLGVLIVSIGEAADASTETELEPLAAKLAQYIDRRRTEEARQQSEQMFRTLANSIPQLAWMARPDGYIFWYNQRWYDFTGATLDEMQGWGWQAVLDPRELPHVLATIQHSFATGEPWEDTFPLRRHDGEFRWHLSRMLPVHDDSGRIVLWFGTNTDITDQRAATAALRRSEAFSRGVVNSSPDCLKVLDLDGRLQWMNDAGQQLMQVCDFDSLRGADWARFWDQAELRDEVNGALDDARRGGHGRFQGFCPTTQGEPRWWDVVITPINGPNDQPEQLLVVSRDITQQREAEEQLRRSEANLRRVIDSMFAFVGILAPDGTLLEANRAPIEAAGLQRDDVIGQPFWDCPWWTHSEDSRKQLRSAFETARSGEVVRYDASVRVQGDQRITIDFQLQPVFDDGELLFVIPSGVDITDRKRAEENLAASQDFLRSALNALSSHIAVLAADGDIIAANQSWRKFIQHGGCALTGYDLGRNYLDAFRLPIQRGEPGVAELVTGIRQVLDGQTTSYTTELPCRAGDEQRWYLLRVNRFNVPGPARAIVAHEDITDRILSEQATRRWSDQLQSLADLSVKLAAAADVSEVLRLVTERACRLVDAQEGETVRLVSTSWSNVLRHISHSGERLRWLCEDWTDAERIHLAVQESNRPQRLTADEWRRQHADDCDQDDDAYSGGCLAAPLTDRDGRNIGLIRVCGKASGEFSDDDEAILVQLAQMTSVALERARLYEEIREANVRKDEFLALLAHELRNPLSALTTGSQLLVLHPQDTPQVAETADVLLRQCFQLKQLVDDLLDVSRVSRGKLNLQFQEVCLQDVLSNAAETSRPVIASAQHKFVLDVCSEPLHVNGDPVRLAQVVSNLLINAAKYTPTGGRVRLSLRRTAAGAIIAVRDNGIGIPAEMLDRIFDLFTQVDSSHTRSQGGLGIGLTLAKTLVDLHQGALRVTSHGEGQGSTFTIQLPLITVSDAERQSSKALSDFQAGLPKRKILVVDDNRAAVHLLSRLLGTLQQEVRTASGGQEALSRLEEFVPDVVVSDVAMPDMSGYELSRAIRARSLTSQPILVALTGYGQESDRTNAFEAGFDHHLTKPVSLDQLKDLLANLPSPANES